MKEASKYFQAGAIGPVDMETTILLVNALKEALAQPAQEPVTFENWHKANYVQNLERYGDTYKNNHVRCRHQGWLGAQSSSPQREWVGLTEEETSGFTSHEMTVVKYVSKVLQEKNHG